MSEPVDLDALELAINESGLPISAQVGLALIKRVRRAEGLIEKYGLEHGNWRCSDLSGRWEGCVCGLDAALDPEQAP